MYEALSPGWLVVGTTGIVSTHWDECPRCQLNMCILKVQGLGASVGMQYLNVWLSIRSVCDGRVWFLCLE